MASDLRKRRFRRALTASRRPRLYLRAHDRHHSPTTPGRAWGRVGGHRDDDRGHRSPGAAWGTWSTGCSGTPHVFTAIGFVLGAAGGDRTSCTCGTERERVATAEPERELIRRVSPFALPAGDRRLRGRRGARRPRRRLVRRHRRRRRLPQLRRQRLVARLGRDDLAHAALCRGARRVTSSGSSSIVVAPRAAEPAGVVLARRLRRSRSCPATIALLVSRPRLLSGRMQADLWSFRGRRGGRDRSLALLARRSSRPGRRTSSGAAGDPSLRSSASRSASTSSSFLVLLTTFVVFVAASSSRFRKPEGGPGQAPEPDGARDPVRPREHRRCRCSAPARRPFVPLLASFFFFIFIGNIFEVVPGHQLLVEQPDGDSRGHGDDLVVRLQHRRHPQARVLRLPQARVHHRRARRRWLLRAADAHRVHHEHRHPADHPLRPTRANFVAGPLPAGGLLPGDRRSSSRTGSTT